MQPLDPSTENALIAHLLQFVTPEKQARMEQVMGNRTSHIRVVLENIFQPQNASAVIRTCECFGIQHLHVVENGYTFKVNPDVARGGGKWLELHRHRSTRTDNSRSCLELLRGLGYRIIATSLDSASVPIKDLPLDQPVALWFGTEEIGLSDFVMNDADLHVHIPMLGFTQSLNVSVSVAVCLYELRNRLLGSGGTTGLNAADYRQAYRRWLRVSLKNCETIERAFLKGLESGY